MVLKFDIINLMRIIYHDKRITNEKKDDTYELEKIFFIVCFG